MNSDSPVARAPGWAEAKDFLELLVVFNNFFQCCFQLEKSDEKIYMSDVDCW